MINHKPKNCLSKPVIPLIIVSLVGLYFLFGTALAAVYGDQLTGANIKLLGLPNLPLVMTVTTKRFTLGQLIRTRAFKFEDISHDIVPCSTSQYRQSLY